MLSFIEIAAVAMLAAGPQHAAPARPAPSKPVAAKASRHVQACAKAYRSYNVRTDTYRDARGKQRRCTL